jgi:hypothetical protein
MSEQLKLFTYQDEVDEIDIIGLDYVFVKEKGGYRLVHSYYNDSRLGQIISAEEAMQCISTCATFNLYGIVAFSETLNLPRRKK